MTSYSIVVPCYRSAATLRELVERIERTMDSIGSEYEILLINDASPDATWDTIGELARRKDRVRGFDLLFNSGQFAATICGLEHAKGEMVFTIDDDLEHVPEEMLKLIAAAEASPETDCFVGTFSRRGRRLHRRFGTWLAGRLHTSLYGAPRNILGSSFRLMNCATAAAICAHQTARPMILPLLVHSTSRIASVSVDHHPRRRGRSGYTWRRLAQLGIAKLVQGSHVVFRTAGILGAACSILSVAAALGTLPGFYSLTDQQGLMLLVAFFAGLVLLLLALIGENIMRLTVEAERPPRYFVKRSIP